MTDNEIIKALGELELYDGFQSKIKILIHNAIYLINRQKTEIERLHKQIEADIKYIKRLEVVFDKMEVNENDRA